MMMPKTDPFSVRLTPDLYERLIAVIQATGGEVTRTALVERSLDMFLRVSQKGKA